MISKRMSDLVTEAVVILNGALPRTKLVFNPDPGGDKTYAGIALNEVITDDFVLHDREIKRLLEIMSLISYEAEEADNASF